MQYVQQYSMDSRQSQSGSPAASFELYLGVPVPCCFITVVIDPTLKTSYIFKYRMKCMFLSILSVVLQWQSRDHRTYKLMLKISEVNKPCLVPILSLYISGLLLICKRKQLFTTSFLYSEISANEHCLSCFFFNSGNETVFGLRTFCWIRELT